MDFSSSPKPPTSGQQQKIWDDLSPQEMLTQLIKNMPAKQIAQILKTQMVFSQVIMEASSSLLKALAQEKQILQDQIFRNKNIKEQDKCNVLDLPLRDLMYHCGKHGIINYKEFLKGRVHINLEEHSYFGYKLVQLKPNQYRIGKKVKLAHQKHSRNIYKQYFPGRPFNYDSQQSQQLNDVQVQDIDPNMQKQSKQKEKNRSDSQSDDSFIEDDEIVQYQEDFSSQKEPKSQPVQDRPKKKLGGKKRIKQNKRQRQNQSSSEQIQIISQNEESSRPKRYNTRNSKKNTMVQEFDLEEEGITTKRRKKN